MLFRLSYNPLSFNNKPMLLSVEFNLSVVNFKFAKVALMELTVVAKSNSFKLALTSEKLSVIVFKLFTIPGTSLLNI